MSDSLAGLFHLSSLVAFMLGIVVTRAYYWWRDRRLDVTDPAAAPHYRRWKSVVMAWALMLIVIGYIGVKTQDTYLDTSRNTDQVKALTQSIAECNREFFATVADRSKWSDETDEWSRQKTDAIAGWLHDIVDPPADILALRDTDPNNPRYQQWAIDTTNKYLSLIEQAKQQQDSSLAQRVAHPLPKPSCGG